MAFGVNTAYATVKGDDLVQRYQLESFDISNASNSGACSIDFSDSSMIYLPKTVMSQTQLHNDGSGEAISPNPRGWFILPAKKGEQTSKYTFYVSSFLDRNFLEDTVILTSGIKYTLAIDDGGCNGAGQQGWTSKLLGQDGLIYNGHSLGGLCLWPVNVSQFESPSYRLTYKPNNGTDEAERYYTRAKGEKLAIEDGSAFTAPDGKTFAGWSTSKDGPVDDKYKPGSTFTMGDADVTLYAQWTSSGTTIACAPQTGADPAASVWQSATLLLSAVSFGLAVLAVRSWRRLRRSI